MQHDFVFLHAQKVPHNYIPLSAKKKYTIVMKKVHEQVAKISDPSPTLVWMNRQTVPY